MHNSGDQAHFAASTVLVVLATLLAIGVSACPAPARPPNPIEQCTELCRVEAKRVCSENDCARGCELVLDRLVEHETKGIVACVKKSRKSCTDGAWAECGALVGPHADGGPPALPPPDPFDD